MNVSKIPKKINKYNNSGYKSHYYYWDSKVLTPYKNII